LPKDGVLNNGALKARFLHSYELVFTEDRGGLPRTLTIAGDTPGCAINWAEREGVECSFEIRQDGRRLGHARFTEGRFWMLTR
jgi:hypothetical protein